MIYIAILKNGPKIFFSRSENLSNRLASIYTLPLMDGQVRGLLAELKKLFDKSVRQLSVNLIVLALNQERGSLNRLTYTSRNFPLYGTVKPRLATERRPTMS